MPADSIREITIQGFKSIASASVPLRPINIVIGANGSGKSNFLEAFSFLREFDGGRLSDYVKTAGGAEKLLHFGSKTTERIHLRALFKGHGHPSYQLILAPTRDDGLYCWHQEINSGDTVTILVDVQGGGAGTSKPENRPYAGWVHEHLNAWQRYHLSDTSCLCDNAAVRDKIFFVSTAPTCLPFSTTCGTGARTAMP